MTDLSDFNWYSAAENQAISTLGRPDWGPEFPPKRLETDLYSVAEIDAATLAADALGLPIAAILPEVATLRISASVLGGIERPRIMEIGGDGRCAAISLAAGFVHIGCEVDADAALRSTLAAHRLAPTKSAWSEAKNPPSAATRAVRLPWWQALTRTCGLPADLVLCRRLPVEQWRRPLLAVLRRSLKASTCGLLWLPQAAGDVALGASVIDEGFRPIGTTSFLRVIEAWTDKLEQSPPTIAPPWRRGDGEFLFAQDDFIDLGAVR